MRHESRSIKIVESNWADNDSVDITGVTRLKHADLWDAAKKLCTSHYGGQCALGRRLGVGASEIGQWINLKACPPRKPTKAWTEDRLHKLECDLAELTGKTLEQLFPDSLRKNAEFLAAPKTCERRFSLQQLALANYAAATTERLVAASMPSIESETVDVSGVIQEAIKCLSLRERQVIEMRYGMNGSPVMTYKEVGESLGVTGARVRQIQANATWKLGRSHVAERLALAIE